jgi:DNA-binding MarR family transcriptional regulator
MIKSSLIIAGGVSTTAPAAVPHEPDPTMDSAEAALHRFATALSGHASDRLLKLNLTIPQMKLLRTVDRLGRASGRTLAEEFSVTPSAIVPICDRLEAQGYLRRLRDTKDRRICWFEVTEKGARMLATLSSSIHSHIRPALDKLSRADRETLAGILDVLASALRRDDREAAHD